MELFLYAIVCLLRCQLVKNSLQGDYPNFTKDRIRITRRFGFSSPLSAVQFDGIARLVYYRQDILAMYRYKADQATPQTGRDYEFFTRGSSAAD